MPRAPTRKNRVRAAIDRQAVVDAAFHVLQRAGLDGLTVRSIAARLGVQNPALYWHFRSKQEIVDAMAERILRASVVEPAPDEEWSAWLRRAARAFRSALLSRRDGAQVVASADLSSTAMATNVDAAIGRLMQSGFKPRDALFGVLAIYDYTLGTTFETQADPVRAGTRRKQRAKAPHLPHFEAALGAGAILEEDTFENGLTLLIDGLAQRRTAPGRT
ncbi:MAG: TetR/AcrR family transcriptional regulator C-terminal domain-containing protein [Myxococcaceae bacterium]|nr:TetR/AcrR family transcriptional regulator C-terminal domain-containing protein [Myxococcaceae bacterium]